MVCKSCNQGLVAIVDQHAWKDGNFKEDYECNNCNAKGYVRGNENEPPMSWDKYGKAFGKQIA